NKGAVRVRDPRPLSLRPDRPVYELCVDALRLEPGPADLARVVGDNERADDEIARLNRPHGGAEFFHDTDVLVSHRQVVDGLGATVGPQVGPANAGRGEPNDRVSRLHDLWVFALLDPD